MTEKRIYALILGAALIAAAPGLAPAAAPLVRGRTAAQLQGGIALPVVPLLSATPQVLALPVSGLNASLTSSLLSPAALVASPVPVSAAVEAAPGSMASAQSSAETAAAQASVKFDGAAAAAPLDPSPPSGAASSPAGHALRLLITGPPGSGKGTYSAMISKDYGVIHISAGELLRQKAKSDPVLAAMMNRGELVPAEIVVSLVKERLAQPDVRRKGYILDGFPRRIVEAEAFKAMLAQGESLDGAIYLDVPQEELLRRILARGRADDSEEVFLKRMKVYRLDTKPAIKEAVRGLPVLRPDVSGPSAETNYGRLKRMLDALLSLGPRG